MSYSRTPGIQRGRIRAVTLNSDQEPSPEQIIQVVNGELRIFQEGQKIGITLPAQHRPLFMTAVQQGYLRYAREEAPVVEAFSWWCDARGIPCVRFEIESDCLDMSTHDSRAKEDPYVRMHFNVAAAGRVFTKPGLVALVELFLDHHLWDMTLSPWEVSAGVLPFSLAHPLLGPVFEIYRTGKMTSEHEDSRMAHPDEEQFKPSGPGQQTIH